MSEPSDDLALSETDLDLIVEGLSSTPLKPANLAAGIVSMRKRLAQLEAEKAKLLDHMDAATEHSEKSLHQHLVEINRDLVAARQRLAHYELQVSRRN